MSSVIEDDYKEDLAIGTGKMVLIWIFLLPLFPIFMLYRIIKHRHYPHKKISDFKLIGLVLLIGFIFLFIVDVSSEPNTAVIIFISLFTLLPAMIMFGVASNKTKKMDTRYILYRDLITENGITSIEEMARLTGQRPNVVKNELKHMIHENLLPDMDLHNNQIIKFDKKLTTMFNQPLPMRFEDSSIRADAPSEAHCDDPSHQNVAFNKGKLKTVQCQGCGASETIMEGTTTKCDYCDNIIS